MSSFGPVTALENLGTSLSQTLAAGDRVIDILEESPVTLVLSNININIAKGGITGISLFWYPTGSRL